MKSGFLIFTLVYCFTHTGYPALANFEQDILPIFASNCLGCHHQTDPAAGLQLISEETILRGSAKRTVITPGDPDASVLIQSIRQTASPKMPPDPLLPLSESEIQRIEAWIRSLNTERDDSETRTEPDQPTVNPDTADDHKTESDSPTQAIEFETQTHAPIPGALDIIGSVAFHPSRPVLAVGRLHYVDLFEIDPTNSSLRQVGVLHGHAQLVRALCFSPDGTLLAAAGGKPSVEGEIIVWDVDNKTFAQTIRGHSDCIYDIEFSHDGTRIASCSYDKTIRLWSVASGQSEASLQDHVDAVYAIEFSPDGKRLASCAGDRTIKIWDTQTGERIFTLSEPLEAQYALSFHPDGRWIAAGGADKTIRIWELSDTTGRLMISKFSHEGAVLDLRFSSDGKWLYSSGEDRFIKTWKTPDIQETQVMGPLSDWSYAFDTDPRGEWIAAGCYDGSIYVYHSKDGSLIAQWNPARVTIAAPQLTAADSSKTLETPDPPDTVVEADREPPVSTDTDDDDPFKVRVVKGNGTYLSSLNAIQPKAFLRGATHTITVTGKNLENAILVVDDTSIQARIIESVKKPLPEFKRAEFTTAAEIVDTGYPYDLTVELTVSPTTRPGIHTLWATTPLATSNSLAFAVEEFAAVSQDEDHDDLHQAPLVPIPGLSAGQIDRSGDRDFYRFQAKAGQELVFEPVGRAVGSGITPLLELYTEQGEQIASSDASLSRDPNRFGWKADQDGEYAIAISDINLNSGGFYRLHIHEKPWITSIFPLGGQRGTTTEFTLEGFNLGDEKTMRVEIPNEEEHPADWNPFQFDSGAAINPPRLSLGIFPEYLENDDNDDWRKALPVEAPCVVNGRIDSPEQGQDIDWVSFTAVKGQPIAIAVEAQQFGSPLDSKIEIVDDRGRPIEIATVRCVAETFLTLSDRDSRSAGLRLDSWTDLRINDYVMIGSEILQVVKLPDYPDEDVLFLNNARTGWRYGLFGTTPSHHAVYTPVYKVELFPPATTFSPNGMPIFHLYAANDDGGAPLYRKDSYIEFHPPRSGRYHVSITDTMGRSGPTYAYRLHIRPPQPDFKVYVDASRPNLPVGGRYPLRITADRLEGFDGPIQVRFPELPEGFSATEATILPGEEDCSIVVSAKAGAVSTSFGKPIKIEASAMIDGKEQVRTTQIDFITIVRQADITIAQTPARLTVQPGESVKCTVTIERHNGFTGRVPIDVRNLPFGVYVLDTGLNGILVTEQEARRTFEIYVEPWVQPMERSIFSIASVETRSPLPHRNASNLSILNIVNDRTTTVFRPSQRSD